MTYDQRSYSPQDTLGTWTPNSSSKIPRGIIATPEVTYNETSSLSNDSISPTSFSSSSVSSTSTSSVESDKYNDHEYDHGQPVKKSTKKLFTENNEQQESPQAIDSFSIPSNDSASTSNSSTSSSTSSSDIGYDRLFNLIVNIKDGILNKIDSFAQKLDSLDQKVNYITQRIDSIEVQEETNYQSIQSRNTNEASIELGGEGNPEVRDSELGKNDTESVDGDVVACVLDD